MRSEDHKVSPTWGMALKYGVPYIAALFAWYWFCINYLLPLLAVVWRLK